MSFANGTALRRFGPPLLIVVAALALGTFWVASIARTTTPTEPVAGVEPEAEPVAVASVEVATPTAAEPEPTAPSHVQSAADFAAAEAGMVIYRDPETGEIGGMPKAGRLAEALALERPRVEPAQLSHPRGGTFAFTDGQVDMFSIVRADENGRLVKNCTHDTNLLHDDCTLPAPVEER